MIQNVFENQIYLGLIKNKNENDKKINKYFEYHSKELYNKHDDKHDDKMDIDQEEDLMDDDTDTRNSIHLERLVLSVVPISTKESWTDNIKNKDTDKNNKSYLFNHKYIVYEYDEDLSKINENRLFVGIAYQNKDNIFIHSWFSIHNFTKLIPTNQNLSCDITAFQDLKITEFFTKDLKCFEQVALDLYQKFDFKSARALMQDVLLELFAGDKVAVDYFILCYISQIFHKLGAHITGRLSINIMDVKLSKSLTEKELTPSKMLNLNDLADSLNLFISNITLFNYIFFQNTIDNLNKSKLYSEFEVESEELKKGLLQTLNHSFLLLDERELTEGKLVGAGVKNLDSLKTLLDLQVMKYEYPYSNVI